MNAVDRYAAEGLVEPPQPSVRIRPIPEYGLICGFAVFIVFVGF